MGKKPKATAKVTLTSDLHMWEFTAMNMMIKANDHGYSLLYLETDAQQIYRNLHFQDEVNLPLKPLQHEIAA